MEQTNYRIELEYLGTCYHGWQRQKDLPTIQGMLEDKISILLKEKVRVQGAGRTDAGVHASKQVANFRTLKEFEPDLFQHQLNSIIPGDISVHKVKRESDDFCARRSAKSREYVYYILNRRYPSAFFNGTSFHYPFELDTGKMKAAAAALTGKHDYYAFCLKDKTEKDTERTIIILEIEKNSDWLMFRIRADSFLYRMVRIMGGMLLKIGAGELSVTAADEYLSKREKYTRFILPAHGLFLNDVFYSSEG